MSPEEYDAWQADLEEMHRTYEAMDQAEYAQFMNELDAREANRANENPA
ncbi:hypothetical protein ACEZCY_35975 [Streptacidiphilus sp. N1-12]|uniref:Uncharacterized protein n=1 Tax=Streptacidiphilus alkalitolerans TaxID=3342712 RepID=A0ABV6WRA5_9ACTN